MPLSRRAAESYSALLGRFADFAGELARPAAARWLAEHPAATFDEAVAAMVSIAEIAAAGPSSAAAEAALRLANAELAAHGLDATDAPPGAEFPVREVVSSLWKHRETWGSSGSAKMAEWTARAAGDAVGHAANRQMLRHGREDVRFARVPSGPRACPWCVALASQGFVYSSADAAGEFASWHDNCRCRVIPSVDAAIEGYDPDEYLRIYLADERIRRMELPEKAKNALRAAYRDSYMGGHAYGREEMDGIFQAGIDSLGKKFRGLPKRRRADYYESSVQLLLGEIGNAYGFDLSGELFYSKTGSPVGAFPSGKELSAAIVFADGRPVRVNALHEIKVPDLLVDGHYIDVKTPETSGGAADRLKRGQKQLASVNEARKEAILDVSYIASREEKLEAMRRARALIDCGKYDAIHVIDRWIKTMA